MKAKAIKANSKLTCMQLKIRWPKTLGHFSRKSTVAAVKPFLTNALRERRLAFATSHLGKREVEALPLWR